MKNFSIKMVGSTDVIRPCCEAARGVADEVGTKIRQPAKEPLALRPGRITSGLPLLAALCAIAVLCFIPPALGAKNVFEGEGRALVQGPDINPARRSALDIALRQAVEEAAGSLLPLKVFLDKYNVLEQKILKEPKKYIENHTVIAEGREADQYRVAIVATVKIDALRADLVALGLLVPESKIPRWMVVVPDRAGDGAWRSMWFDGSGGKSSSEAALEEMVRDYGYRVVAPDPKGARLPKESLDAALGFIETALDETAGAPKPLLELAAQRGATHLVVGKGVAQVAEGLSGPQYSLGTAGMKLAVISVADGKTLSVMSKKGAVETIGATGLDARILRMTAHKFSDELSGIFNSINPAGEQAGFAVVSIVLGGVTSYEQYAKVKEVLEREIRGVRDVKISKLAPGSVELTVSFAGEPGALIEALMKHDFQTFQLKDEGAEGGVYRLTIK